MKKISFVVDGQKLTGTLQYPQTSAGLIPAVLFIHGWTSSEKGYISRAEAVANLGYICLTFTMRGHGDSQGNLNDLSRKDHLNDCIAAFDFLGSQPDVDENRIHVVGASYGGYMASLLSAKRRISSLVLRAPALYPDKKFDTPTQHLIRSDIHVYRQQYRSAAENKALTALHEFQGNVLLLECEHDEDVPKTTTESFANAVADPKQLTRITIPGADHSLTQPQWNRFFIDRLVDWFTKIHTS